MKGVHCSALRNPSDLSRFMVTVDSFWKLLETTGNFGKFKFFPNFHEKTWFVVVNGLTAAVSRGVLQLSILVANSGKFGEVVLEKRQKRRGKKPKAVELNFFCSELP